MANDIIDINVTETVETVSITVNPNLTTVNINKVTGGGASSPITIVNDSSLFSTGLTETGAESNANNSNFLGQYAGQGATNASDSNFFGYQSGKGAINAEVSNFLGYGSGYAATDASNSNFLGQNAGNGAANANDSNFIGYSSGSQAISASFSNFIGWQSGQQATNASYSNLLGYKTGLSFTNNNIGSNNIIIGTNISLPDAVVNGLNIGGILFGTGTYSTLIGNPSITPKSGGKIGIGVVNPTNTLHIYSEAANASGLRLERLTSASPTSTGQAIGVDASGNVVTVTGGGGSQNLQSVTNIGATTTNKITINPTIDTDGLIINASGTGVGANIVSIDSDAGVFESTNAYGINSYSVNSTAVYAVSSNSAAFVGYGTSGMNLVGTADGITVTANDDFAAAFNQGLTAKGLVINSGTSSSGNFIDLYKNSVNKLSVNQAGELTAEKLIKNGGTSSQYLMADGSVSTGSTSTLSNSTASGTDTYTATISGVTSYVDGSAYLIRFTNGNTSTATLNINSLGARTLYRNNDGVLIGGDIQSGGEMLCVYSSALSAFKCIGTSPNDIIAYVTNADSVTITKGMPVYAFGGTGDRMTVKRAYNTLDATSAQTVGLVMSASIAAGQKGYIITQGLLDGLSTLPASTFADGDTIYLGATAGTITNIKPSAPNHLVYLGVVTTSSNGAAGRMYVKPQNGYELDEIHDVSIVSKANNDIIAYDSATSLWKNKSIPTVLGYTPQNKSLSAYSMVANNTASTANATEFTFRKFDQATYGGTPAWVGTSAPTTITAQSYSGQQVGNMVSINLSVVYTNAGIANTQVTLPLPSDFPTPLSPTGFTAGLDVIAYGTGQIMANTSQTVATGARGCFLRRNTTNNGYEFFLNVSVATAAKVVMLNLTYQTS